MYYTSKKKRMKARYKVPVVIALIILLFAACKKEKAENGLEGHWLVDSEKTQTILDQDHPLASISCGDHIKFSGELTIDENGDGNAIIYGTFCDTTMVLFDKDIEELGIIDHSRDVDWDGTVIHWYQGYFNWDIYFTCGSTTDEGIITKNTSEIGLNIRSLIDNTTGVAVENYSLNLILKRD